MVQFNKLTIDHPDFAYVQKIRKIVFVDEQNVNVTDEYDSYEGQATHYLLKENNLPVGVARSRKTDVGIKLERFAVLSNHRGKGYGKQIVHFVLNDVCNENNCVYLHAQLPVVEFYKQFGFGIVGNIFNEAGIDHYKMILQLNGPIENIH